MTIRLSASNPAIVVWMTAGEAPNEIAFKLAPRSSNPAHFPNLESAVHETLSILSKKTEKDDRQPWIFCGGEILNMNDIRMHDASNSAARSTIFLR